MSQEVQAVTSGEAGMGDVLHNKSANTDPQQQEAASPLMLVVRLPLRYVASNTAAGQLCALGV
jgi:hypothetical protein